MRTMARVVVVVILVAALSATMAVMSSEAFGPVKIVVGGAAPLSVGTGSNASDHVVTTSDGGIVLCCWTCPKDGQRKCGMRRTDVCSKYGEEVASCSECQ